MRRIWLASTALLLTAGIACAQSTSTSAPAPDGAISAPQASSASGSPGKMAPASTSSGSPMSSDGSANAGVASPAPDGAVSAPDVTQSAAPGTAPGKMAPGPNADNAPAMSGGMGGGAMGGSTHHHHWAHGMAGGKLPEDASAKAYLHMAGGAIRHHNAAMADDALSHAETRLLNRSVPQGDISADDSPAIQSIEAARQAVHAGDFTKAAQDTKAAWGAAGGM